MKRMLYTLVLLSLLFSAAEAQTVKKNLLEEFTGAWCGGCPDATLKLESMLTTNPGICIPVTWHHGDALTITDCASIEDAFQVGFFPMGTVNRYKWESAFGIAFTHQHWIDTFNAHKNDSAIVSISFDNPYLDAGIYKAKVKMKFLKAPAAGVPVKMNVYLTEDSIAATGNLEQENYYANIQNGNNPLINWFHNSTMRQSLGGIWGFNCFPANIVVGTVYTQDISFTIPGTWNKDHINLIAFVAYDGDTADNRKESLNAEQMKLSGFAALGVAETMNSRVLGVYPNPARTDDVVKISFNLKVDAEVKIEIYNMLGQSVSGSYESFEIAGIHTIQWSLRGEKPFVPGTYFIKMTTDKGDAAVSKMIVE